MDETLRLIRQLDTARQQMRVALIGFARQTEVYPRWTVKQLLAHVAGWDDAATSSLRAHAGGAEPATPAASGIDEYNVHSVETRDALNYEQVVAEWELARDQLKLALFEMPAERFAERLLYPWGRSGTIARLVAILADHEEEHAEEIRQLGAGESKGAIEE